MALSTKTNRLTGPSITGTSASTDPGFQPKLLLLWNGLQTTNGPVSSAQFSLGAAVSSSVMRVSGYNSLNNAASSDVVAAFNTSRILLNTSSGTTTNNLVTSLSSFDTNGFTLNWATLTTTSPLYNYLALGGNDITNVATGSFSASTTTGNQSVTSLAFQPDIVLFFGNLNTTSATTNGNSCYTFGVATNALNCWAFGLGMQHNQATMNVRRAFYPSLCFMHPQAGSNTVEATAQFVSMNSNGFTINWTDAPGQADLVGYVAIKGGRWKVGTETQKTSTGTKATTGVGFQPKGLIFATHCATATSSVIDHARLSIGATTGTGNNIAIWTGDQDNVPNAITNTIMSNTKCIVMATEGGSPTTQAEAALSSFNSDGFTLDWTTADATARAFGYIAFGDSLVPSVNALLFGSDF